jgi:LuxR family maltose regulon positive regulatory protein
MERGARDVTLLGLQPPVSTMAARPAPTPGKFRLPARPERLVERTRLLRELEDRCPVGSVCVVAAPAGWGKSTLVAEWSRATLTETAWFSVDERDDHPSRFWIHANHALRSATDAKDRLPTTEPLDLGASDADHLPEWLISNIEGLGSDITLVFDDYHAVEDPAIHKGLNYLIDRLPTRCRLVVISRCEPPLRTARHQLSGHVVAVGVDDLRFDYDEAHRLIEQHARATLDTTDTRRVVDRIEGWPAGLQFAGLALQGSADLGRVADRLDDGDRQLVDYFAAEVLDNLRPEIRSFLRRTSILRQLSPELCDALIGGNGSLTTLEALERDQMFLVRLNRDPRWYRYHPLFAEILRSELQRTEPDVVSGLHRVAAGWFSDNLQAAEAVEHAVASSDEEFLSEIVVANYPVLLKRGQFGELTDALEVRLPGASVRGNGHLALARALVLVGTGELGAAERWLDTIAYVPEQRGPFAGHLPSISSALYLLRAQLACYGGDVGAAIRWDELARDSWPDDAPPDAYVASFVVAAARLRCGQPSEALGLLASDESWARETNNLNLRLLVQPLMAAAWLQLGVLPATIANLEEFDALAGQQTIAPRPSVALATFIRGWLAWNDNEVAQACALAMHAAALARTGNDRLCLLDALDLLSKAQRRMGSHAEARESAAEALHVRAGCADRGLPLADTFAAAKPPSTSLTPKQLEVFALLASGLTNVQIARHLAMSERTVHAHLRAIYSRLGVSNRTAALRAGIDGGLI